MSNHDKAKSANTPVHLNYCHPLRLQQLSPEQFTVTVNKILSGKLKLLIERIDPSKR
ncbi:MAG: hypothetical protein KKG33_09815 [candidate division Zixibacteria bacterium]|nr:hypothetical protein [candidate division Zixibacteria bacterium]MBU1471165.1 hypothetical protein [candidate division Zixibacteria bacterium]MBU2625844.1 hypothetical protein [candidate division Zixibacteria bacterium]